VPVAAAAKESGFMTNPPERRDYFNDSVAGLWAETGGEGLSGSKPERVMQRKLAHGQSSLWIGPGNDALKRRMQPASTSFEHYQRQP
jgi:hypothetical protein